MKGICFQTFAALFFSHESGCCFQDKIAVLWLRVSRFQWQSLPERVEMSAKTAFFVGEGSDLL
jgi:hypothetical protein